MWEVVDFAELQNGEQTLPKLMSRLKELVALLLALAAIRGLIVTAREGGLRHRSRHGLQ
jgi:hypothetical protein